MSAASIRRVEQGDLPALLDIYNHYVRTTPITFDEEPRTLVQRQEWLDSFASSGRHQSFVAVEGGRPVGWACSGKFKEKAAYDTSVELSVYLDPAQHGKGLGRRLYETLIPALKGQDIHRLFAGITQPNAASVALHLAFGFSLVGVQPEVGRKFGQFWDVALYQRAMD
jgi:phosphinothricin acetyltransferase